MSTKKLLIFLTLIVSLIGCNYQNEETILGNTEVAVNEELVPDTPTVTPDAEKEVVGEDGVILVSKLKDLELFDLWDIFFSKFVVPVNKAGEGFDTRVDYENLHKLNSSNDRLFLHLVSSIEKQMNDIDLSTKSDTFKKAFYINAYNYSAIRVVNKRYIGSRGQRISSIRKLSRGLNRFQIFKQKITKISGRDMSLDDIEKTEIVNLVSRGGVVEDARYHFAVICVAGGCPVTLNKAYTEDNLEESLNFITSEGLKLPRILQRNGSQMSLTKIISEWYTKHFVSDSGSVKDFLEKFGVINAPRSFSKLSYDWDLNILETTRATPDLSELETLVPVSESDIADSSDTNEEQSNEELTGCAKIRNYKVVVNCKDVVAASESIDDLNVCIYQKKSGPSKGIQVVQSYSKNGEKKNIDHSFKSESLDFSVSKKSSFLGFGSKKKATFKFSAEEYSFEKFNKDAIVIVASCESL